MNALVAPFTNLAWPPLASLSRTLVLSLLHRIEVGSLRIVDASVEPKQDIQCGASVKIAGRPHVEVTVRSDAFWVRCLLFADMLRKGFAESYMLGEFDCDDLTSFFELFIANRAALSNGTTASSALVQTLASAVRRTNTLSSARLNAAAHYDISNDMFAAFLSPDMTYSCPIWAPASSPGAQAESLESAQVRKLQRIVDEARLTADDRVLEIGTGWGSLAMHAVRTTGCRVTSVTLSVEQKRLAEERIRAAGLDDRIEVRLCDYRDLRVPDEGPYDKVVSVEMLEAVGREFLEVYFGCVHRLLKKDGGIAVFQCITMPEGRYESYHASTDFIRSYIFPGGHLPSVTALISACTAGSKGTLIPQNLLNIGPHYARTLRKWGEAFSAAFPGVIARELRAGRGGIEPAGKGNPGRKSEDVERDVETFRRKWMYYFAYCEAGFATCTLGDVVLTVAREGAGEMARDVIL